MKQRTHLQSSLPFDSTVRGHSVYLACDTKADAGQRGSISTLKELQGRGKDNERQKVRNKSGEIERD